MESADHIQTVAVLEIPILPFYVSKCTFNDFCYIFVSLKATLPKWHSMGTCVCKGEEVGERKKVFKDISEIPDKTKINGLLYSKTLHCLL